MRSIWKDKKTLAYIGLLFVVFIWGTAPLTSKYYLQYYSPTFGVAWASAISALTLAIMFRKRLKNLTRDYFKVALPLGLFYTTANLSQKIGLQYTTPTVYSFLENLSCIVVPFLVWWLIKKKPTAPQIIGSVICLASAFILSGLGDTKTGFSLGLGEILCALAGILYGVNIAGTGVFTKKFDSALYIMVLLAIDSALSFITAFAFHYIKVDGVAIETIRFSWNPIMLLSRIVIVLITSALCCVIRTSSMKHVDASVVAVIMPFASIITGVLSVAFGMDTLSYNLVVGAILGFVAMLICAWGDILSLKSTRNDIEKPNTETGDIQET